MALYTYKGLEKGGKEVKGSVAAESVVQAKQKVKTMGIMLMEIHEQSSDVLKSQATISLISSVSKAELALMTRQLSTLIKAKIQIVEALGTLMDQMENPHMKVMLSEIRQKVNEGSSLAKAFADYPKIFDNVFINMVDAGEASGTLEIVLIRLAEFSENQVKLTNRIKGAMTYPLIMILFGGLMIGIIFIFVIPKITKIFITMKKALPIQTKICIFISNFLQNYWWAAILGIFLSYFSFKKYIRTVNGEKRWHSFLLKMPVVKTIVMMINVSRFCSTLSTLLNSGVPILTSMKIVKNLISNVHMRDAVEEARVAISEGASMTGPLIKCGHFPPMVTHMIRLGERSGELEPMLNIIAENYEEQVNTKLSGLTSILEPIMMVCMGGAVAFIVFSVVVPMMELNSVK